MALAYVASHAFLCRFRSSPTASCCSRASCSGANSSAHSISASRNCPCSMSLNELIDLLKKGKKVLYIDTEIDTDEKTRIDGALLFLEDHEFIHENHPILTTDSLISIAKQAKHKFNVDVVIVDYLK